jgi:pimeloyl-ACP methyl ester carboxylesterase
MWCAALLAGAAERGGMKQLRLQINGIDYVGVEAGEGPLLILCHGTFGGKALMRPQIEALSPHFRCVAFDWRGHGQTGYNDGGWTHVELVADLRLLIGVLGEERAILAGVSQGGAISTRLALTHPECVAGVVNMCAGPGRPPLASLKRLDALAATLAHEPDEKLRRCAVEAFATAVFHAPGFAEREPARFATEIDVFLSHPRGAAKLLCGVSAHYDEVLDRLSEISCPYLVIWGECDGRPEMGQTIAGAVPNAELLMVPNAGHHVNVDAPDTCSAAIKRFALKLTAS